MNGADCIRTKLLTDNGNWRRLFFGGGMRQRQKLRFAPISFSIHLAQWSGTGNTSQSFFSTRLTTEQPTWAEHIQFGACKAALPERRAGGSPFSNSSSGNFRRNFINFLQNALTHSMLCII